MGSGVSNQVVALTIDGRGALLAGGSFVEVCGDVQCATGNTTVNRIARYGGRWSAVGDGGTGSRLGLSGSAAVLALMGSDVYVGGSFDRAGSTTVNRIARWDGTGWSALGFGFNSEVLALAVDRQGVLYAGGQFTFICGDAACTFAAGTSANRVARWDGTSWSTLGFGVDDYILALAVDGQGALYAGGFFRQVCGNALCVTGNTIVNSVAKWNGTAWNGSVP